MHIQSFLIYYLFFNSEQGIRAVAMMGCELQDEFWGMRFSFSMVRFLFICYLMETTWQWRLGGCVCVLVKVPFFTELLEGTTYSLNFVYRDFVNLVHSKDLMKLHLWIPDSSVRECSRKNVMKANQSFLTLCFSLSGRDVRMHVLPLSGLFSCCSPHAYVLIFVFHPSSVT